MLTVLRHIGGFVGAVIAGALAAQLALTALVVAVGASAFAFTEAGLLRFAVGSVYLLAWVAAGAILLGVPMIAGLRATGHRSLAAFALAGALTAAAAALALRVVFGHGGWEAGEAAILAGAFAFAGIVAATVYRGIAGPRVRTARTASRARPATASCAG
jgi:hypothetical protein